MKYVPSLVIFFLLFATATVVKAQEWQSGVAFSVPIAEKNVQDGDIISK